MPSDGAGLTVEVRRVRRMRRVRRVRRVGVTGEPLDQISAGMTGFSRCDGRMKGWMEVLLWGKK